MMKQKGITLVGAIFILIIVSLLGQYLIKITGVQRQTSIMTLQSARAYQAANAGIEWGIFGIVNGANCPGINDTDLTIGNFATTVLCSAVGTYNEDGTEVTIFQITAESEYGSYGQIDYVSRELQVMIHFP
jgi:MSHA biogenesis protein MshP